MCPRLTSLLAAVLALAAHAQVQDPLLEEIDAPPEKVANLEEALALLRAFNSDLRIQAERVRIAEADRQQVLARVLPTLTGMALAQQNLLHPGENFVAGLPAAATDGPRPTHVLGFGTVTANLPLVDVSAWHGLVAAAKAAHAAELSQQELQRTLVRDLARRLIGALTVERLAELERVALRNALERLELGRKSLRLGATNRLDVMRLEQDFQVARGAVLEANEQLRRAREGLGLLLGRDAALGVGQGFDLDGLVEQTRAVCHPIGALGERADLRAQRLTVEAARQRVEDASAQYLPTLGLRSEVFALTVDPGPLLVPAWNVAAVLNLTFWDGGARLGNSARVQAQLRQAQEQAALLQRTAQVEVTQSVRAIEVARERLRESGRATTLAQESDALTRRSFELGRGSSLDLVQAASIRRQAELNQALREFDLATAVVDALAAQSSCRLAGGR